MQRKLCRATMDKKVFGVCGGLAHYFQMDSTVIRLIAALLILVGGLSVWVYVIFALIMPETDEY